MSGAAVCDGRAPGGRVPRRSGPHTPARPTSVSRIIPGSMTGVGLAGLGVWRSALVTSERSGVVTRAGILGMARVCDRISGLQRDDVFLMLPPSIDFNRGYCGYSSGGFQGICFLKVKPGPHFSPAFYCGGLMARPDRFLLGRHARRSVNYACLIENAPQVSRLFCY